jgi:hypothetical protein
MLKIATPSCPFFDISGLSTKLDTSGGLSNCKKMEAESMEKQSQPLKRR